MDAVSQAKVQALLDGGIMGFIPSVSVEGFACGQHRKTERCRKGVVAQHIFNAGQMVQWAARTSTAAAPSTSPSATRCAHRQGGALIFVFVDARCFHLVQGKQQDALPRFLEEFELVLTGGQGHTLGRSHRTTEARCETGGEVLFLHDTTPRAIRQGSPSFNASPCGAVGSFRNERS